MLTMQTKLYVAVMPQYAWHSAGDLGTSAGQAGELRIVYVLLEGLMVGLTMAHIFLLRLGNTMVC